MTKTKQLRLLNRIREIEDRLERLGPDLEYDARTLADEAWARVVEIRQILEGK